MQYIIIIMGQVLGFKILQLSRYSAFLFISRYVSSSTSSIMPIHGLPLGLFPSILPSSTNFIRPSPLTTCPIQSFFLSHIVSIKLLFSFKDLSTCPFVLLSIQLNFPILLHTHISKAFKRFISSFLMVHVSYPYRTTGHTSILTNLFLRSTLILQVSSSFLLLNTSLAVFRLSIKPCSPASVLATMPLSSEYFTSLICS